MKFYVTFGRIHTHSINGKTVDKDCVARLDISDEDTIQKTYEKASDKIYALFGQKFSRLFTEFDWDEKNDLPYYPKGYVEID